jgi:hypothetical protein
MQSPNAVKSLGHFDTAAEEATLGAIRGALRARQEALQRLEDSVDISALERDLDLERSQQQLKRDM